MNPKLEPRPVSQLHKFAIGSAFQWKIGSVLYRLGNRRSQSLSLTGFVLIECDDFIPRS